MTRQNYKKGRVPETRAKTAEKKKRDLEADERLAGKLYR